MSASQNALVLPTLDSYVVSCSCGWVGASHDSPEPAEREARDHEDNPAEAANGRPQPSPSSADDRPDQR
jgi:hypothetical protein